MATSIACIKSTSNASLRGAFFKVRRCRKEDNRGISPNLQLNLGSADIVQNENIRPLEKLLKTSDSTFHEEATLYTLIKPTLRNHVTSPCTSAKKTNEAKSSGQTIQEADQVGLLIDCSKYKPILANIDGINDGRILELLAQIFGLQQRYQYQTDCKRRKTTKDQSMVS